MNDINKSLDTKETNKHTAEIPALPEPYEIISKLKALSTLFCYSSWADAEMDIKREELYGVHSILDGVVQDLERLNNKQQQR